MRLLMLRCLSCLLLALLAAAAAVDAHTVLVMGGTQFMGRLLIEDLLRRDDGGLELFMMNRGHSRNPFADDPRVRLLRCDRFEQPELCAEHLGRQPFWDVIVDFIGFHEEQMASTVRALSGGDDAYMYRVGHYVYVSTDSVYMACALPPGKLGAVAEDDCQYPVADAVDARLRAANEYQHRYGGNKLRCERALAAAEGFPYTALRLPDVVGPHDNLGVFAGYVQQVLDGEDVPVGLGPDRHRSGAADPRTLGMSFVYAPDVVAAVAATLEAGAAVFGQALNVASPETPTLVDLLRLISDELGVDAHATLDEWPPRYPHVDFGAVDTRKAAALLPAWRPTPLPEYVRATTRWYAQDRRRLWAHMDYRCPEGTLNNHAGSCECVRGWVVNAAGDGCSPPQVPQAPQEL